jgi:DNA-binding SARP family transcriptional activator/tetratricopeptide (TPR) repeat protein
MGMTGVDGATLRLQLLGPVRAWRGEQEVRLGPAQQRAVLAVLALAAGKLVSRHELIDAVWDTPPDAVGSILYKYISQLRTVLEPGRSHRAPGQVLVSSGPGYLLRVPPEQVDAVAFIRQVDAARRARAANELASAAQLFEAALELWQGTALAGMAGRWAQAERARLEEAWLAGQEEHAAVKLALGCHAEMAAGLTGLVGRYPLREGLAGLLMVALYRCGRQAEALTVFHDTRRLLVAELGIEPGPELRRLHERVLAADPALAAPAGPPVVDGQPAPPLDRPASPPGRPASLLEVRYSLPPDAAAFTGRDAELRQITSLMTDTPSAGGVVAIHAIGGMPGVGKTALAVHVAHRLRDRFPDRQLFVDLQAHTPGQDPVPAGAALAGLLTAVGVDARSLPERVADRAGLWRDRMAGQRALLVLDNAASSSQVAPLLPGGKDCLVLVTSRRYLGDLPGAVVPVLLEVLPPGQAQQMFLHLAPRARNGPAAAVAELVRLAGFLPLAISLLARLYARHPAWTLADLTAETEASMLTLAAENDSVAAAFEVSYHYLPAAQQQFLRRLGLHPGTTIDTYAAAALAGTTVPEAAGFLDALHREAILTEPGRRRYGMHDLIRRYAKEHAAADPAADRAQALERLLDFYSYTATLAESRLARQTRSSRAPEPVHDPAAVPRLPDGTRALAWARAERANLLTCLDYAAGTGAHARVVALTAALAALLLHDGPWTDAISRHTTAVRAARQLGDRLGQAGALSDLGVVRRMTGEYQDAADALTEALAIYRDLGDRLGQASTLNDLGVVWRMTGQYQDAADALTEALAIYRDLGDRLGQASTLNDLGVVRRLTGRYQDAADALTEALGIYRDLGDRLGQANSLSDLGDMWRLTGQYQDAADALQEALPIYRDLGDRLGQANALNYLGALWELTGDYRSAASALQEALGIYRDLGSRLGEANSLSDLGAVRRMTGEYQGAADALAEALDIYRDLGDRGGEVELLNEVGTLQRMRGDLGLAEERHQQALALAREIDSSWDEGSALAGLGRCALAAGRTAEARAFLRQAQQIFQQTGAAEATTVAAELDALTAQEDK